MTDPLFTEEEDRNSIFPLRYPKLYDAYKFQRSCFWTTHEVDLTSDRKDLLTLSKDEQHFIKMVLAFFSSADLIVKKNIDERFLLEVKILEARTCYTYQAMMEDIHSEMYGLLVDTYITDLDEKDKIFNAVRTIPSVSKLAAWAYKWIESDRSYAERLVAFAMVEGLFFSGPFCAIYWMKERGKLLGLGKSNDFIARDEGQHVDFAAMLHSMCQTKCPESVFNEIIKEALALSIEFITEALPCQLIGMNSTLMKQYVGYIANRLAKQFGFAEIFPGIQQPFTFMDRIGLSAKSNFFECTVTQYNKIDNSASESADPYAGL